MFITKDIDLDEPLNSNRQEQSNVESPFLRRHPQRTASMIKNDFYKVTSCVIRIENEASLKLSHNGSEVQFYIREG